MCHLLASSNKSLVNIRMEAFRKVKCSPVQFGFQSGKTSVLTGSQNGGMSRNYSTKSNEHVVIHVFIYLFETKHSCYTCLILLRPICRQKMKYTFYLMMTTCKDTNYIRVTEGVS